MAANPGLGVTGVPLLAALWLGILTSVSPCPLATNLAAVSFVGRRVGQPSRVLFTGLLYTVGRAFAYAVLGTLLVTSLLSAVEASRFLQQGLNRVLGPILILVGMGLLGLLPLPSLPSLGTNQRVQRLADRGGPWGAFSLGALFALSFCPVSAALFFGSLLPLAVAEKSGVLLPSVFGMGTGLPVLVFAFLLAFGAKRAGEAFRRIESIELWARRLTGAIFLAVGLYYSWIYLVAPRLSA